MGKPFSDLEKRAIAILGNSGDPAQSQDKELANYWKWRINPSLDSHDLPDASTRTEGRKLNDIGIRPFGIDLPLNVLAKVTISERTQNILTDGQETALQIEELEAADASYRLARFTPARVYWRTGAATTPVTRTSRITGRKYKSYYTEEDQGYTAPFGETEGGATVAERQAAIRAAIQTGNSNIDLLTFSPEKSRN